MKRISLEVKVNSINFILEEMGDSAAEFRPVEMTRQHRTNMKVQFRMNLNGRHYEGIFQVSDSERDIKNLTVNDIKVLIIKQLIIEELIEKGGI